MNKLLSILFSFLCLFTNFVNAQTILPLESTQMCPLEEIVFNVSLPGTEPRVSSGLNTPNLILGQYDIITDTNTGITTFKFRGSFKDANVKQVFRVTYKNYDGDDVIKDFEYKYVKSLFHNTNCALIAPDQGAISAPLCEINNYLVSFTNVKWGTHFESPTLCFGTITTYEYQLPAGWSIGANVSTGSNWIPGNNSVTITSDRENGNGGYVRIRPVNNCASGLNNNQQIAVISVIRPTPASLMSVSGANTVCSGNNYTYTLNGLPSGASVSWASNSYYSTTGSGTSITISPYSYSNGGTSVLANVTLPNCNITFPISKYINIGVPYVTFNINSYPNSEPNCYEPWGIYSFQATLASGRGHTGYQWGYRITGVPGEVLDIYDSPYYTFIPEQSGTYEIFVRPKNDCGTGTTESVKTVAVSDFCGGGARSSVNQTKLYPNPISQSELTVVLSPDSRSNVKSASLLEKTEVSIESLDGKLISVMKIPASALQTKVDVSKLANGIYIVKIKRGDTVEIHKIIVKK